jgi:hypothetical protein
MAATFERHSVTTELATAMIKAAEQKAADMGHAFVIVSGGHYSQDMEAAHRRPLWIWSRTWTVTRHLAVSPDTRP